MATSGITGLSSGMDIDSMVTSGMSAYQTRYDSMYKQEQKAEWTKDAYNEWYDKLTDFQNNTLYKYALSSGMNPKEAASSNDNVVTATAGGSAANISHNITVGTLASSAYLKSVSKITPGSDSIKLSDAIGLSDVTLTATSGTTQSSDTLTFKIGSNSYTLTGSQMDETALSFTIGDGGDTTKTISFSYRDLAEATYNDLSSKINNSGLNIGATYDSANDSFGIYNKSGGADNKISIKMDSITLPSSLSSAGLDATNNSSSSNTKNLFAALNLGEYNSATDSLGTAKTTTDYSNGIEVAGTDGSVKIDGRSYTTTGSQIAVDGVTYNLLSTSTSSATVTVSTDTDTIVENVKNFVKAYNELLSGLKEDIYEETNSDYEPLTEDEKKDMSEDQITAWEKKAKAGMLYKDSTLTKLVSNMRSAVNTSVSGINSSYNSLYNIGIEVSADWESDSSGILSVDEDKLTAALTADPESAYKLFANSSYDEDDEDTYGIVRRLNNSLSTAIGTGTGETATGIKGMAGVDDSTNYSDESFWGEKIADWKQKMEDFQDVMDNYQDNLYDQFDDMETAISNLSTQYSYVSSYLGSS